jgi:hypothetical protein
MRRMEMLYIDRRTRIILISLWTATAILFFMTLLNPDNPISHWNISPHEKDVYKAWYGAERNMAKIRGEEYQYPAFLETGQYFRKWKWGIGFLVIAVITGIYTGVIFRNITDLKKLKEIE